MMLAVDAIVMGCWGEVPVKVVIVLGFPGLRSPFIIFGKAALKLVLNPIRIWLH